jgi:hypothetical protein
VASRLVHNTRKCFAGRKPIPATLTQIFMKTLFDLNYNRMVANIDRSFKSFC